MTARQTGQIEIDKPRQAVWRQISALADVPAWYDEWDRCVHDPDQTIMREGQAFRLVADGAKRTRVADCHVITVEEPTLVRWIEHRRLRRPVLVEFRLTAVSDQRTVVSHSKTTGTLHRRK